jgi:hypothetical protein
MSRKLMQMGYVAPDLDKALNYWIDVAGAGPFYIAEYEPEQQVYRGQPTHISFRLAYGFLGDVHIEVVQQLKGGKSAYTEALENGSTVSAGGVLHHILLKHDGYDAIYNQYLAAGAERCYDAVVPVAGRFCYLDTRKLMGCYLELVEDTSGFELACAKMRETHLGWDGANPRRSFDEIVAMLG